MKSREVSDGLYLDNPVHCIAKDDKFHFSYENLMILERIIEK